MNRTTVMSNSYCDLPHYRHAFKRLDLVPAIVVHCSDMFLIC